MRPCSSWPARRSGRMPEGREPRVRGSGHTLPTTATTDTAGSAAATAGNCVMPTSSIGYPVTLPAGAGPPTAVKLYNAASGTGQGPTNVTLTFQLAVPANTFRGAYTSTWTFAAVSGP